MKALFDTDVILDLLLDRAPFSEPAARVFSLVERGEIAGCVAATTVTTLYYLAQKARGRIDAKKAIRKLLSLLDVAPVNRSVLESAMESSFVDFEDGVVSEAARQAEAKVIVTRNIRHFRGSKVPAHSPAEILTMILAGRG